MASGSIQVKQFLQDLVKPFGKEVLIRIACRELEAWYLGDLAAVSKAYGRDVSRLSKQRKYRNPDAIGNPKEELRKLFPKHQQLDGARKIAVHMDIEHNTSVSFNQFILGVKKFAG